jgi:DNA-binding MarR family transcriptional regulator
MQQQQLQRHEPLGLLIARVRSRLKRTVGGLVRPYRLSPQQFWVLVAIAEREGPSLGQVAGSHVLDEPTASRIVTTLARRRLVVVGGDPDDRRRLRLELTPAGKELAARLLPLAAEIRAAATEGLDEDEKERIAAALRRILTNLDRLAARHPARRAAGVYRAPSAAARNGRRGRGEAPAQEEMEQ